MTLSNWLALALAALIVFVLANAYPVASLEVQGMVQRASLLDAIRVTWQQQHWVVAIMTGLAGFGMPLVQLMVLLWVLGPLAAGRLPVGFRGAMRFLGLLRPWSMVQVFLLGVVVSVVKLRLREFVFSLVTYAVAVVAVTVAANWAFLGGSDGLRGLPTLDLSVAGLSLTARNDEELWPYAFGLLVVVIYLIDRFRHSRLGTAAIMVHQNPRLATMSGIDPARVRLQVFLFSAPISAAAGWLYAYQRAYVSADILETYFLILMLTAVVLVGRRQLLGPLLATALVLVQEKFFSFGGYVDKIVLGSVLVLVLAFFPQGLMGLVRPMIRHTR